jgi:hypothetical protein
MFILKSPAFADGEPIPEKHARTGSNVSPPLEWMDPPAATRSYALLMVDPDAPGGTFSHWGLFHIAAGRTLLPEAVEAGAKTEDFGFCVNDFGALKYDGPEPPEGDPPHRYVFRLAALDTESLGDKPKMGVDEMWRAAEPHILATTELTGRFGR